jgi:GNAT superfamily N-acetyltransferase
MPVTVRPVEQGDLEAIVEMHQRLSKDSIYYRYLAARGPTPADLECLCALQGENGASIVATVAGPQEKVVAMACYGVDPDNPTIAEPAILVEDGYQGRGLGKRVLLALLQEARRNGLEAFHCYVHPINRRVIRLVESCGLRCEISGADGLIEVRVWL